MSDIPASEPPDSDEESVFSPEAVLTIFRRFWFPLLLATAAGAAVAYYWAGRQSYVYSKTAGIILKEEKSGFDTASDKLMKEFGMDAGAANIANESCVLKSTALMQKTVEALGANVRYWAPSRFRLEEIYDATPFLVDFSGIDERLACELSITPTDAEHFSLTCADSSGRPMTREAAFNEAVELPFGSVSIRPTTHMSDSCIGVAYTVRRQSALAEAQTLLAQLTVARPLDKRDASLLELTLTGNNPKRITDILNKLVDVYNQTTQDAKGEAARKTESFIRARLAEIGAALSSEDSQIAQSKSGSAVSVTSETVISADFTTIESLKSEIFKLETEEKMLAALSSNLENAGEAGGMIALDTGVADSGLSDKIEGYNEAYLEYRRLAGSAGAKNPAVVALRDKMAATLTAAKRALNNYSHNQGIRLNELKGKLAEVEARMSKTAEHDKLLTPLMREHKVKEELYMLLLTKEQENALALALATPSAIVLESAHGSDSPVSPNTRLLAAAGAGAGALLCFGFIFGLIMLDNKVKTRRQIEAQSPLPIIGELPALSRKDRRAVQKQPIISAERSQMAESLHILRNNAESLLPRTPGRALVYLLTSSIPGEGKTFLSCNLAATFAKIGRRVLLVDCDLRKRSLTRSTGGKGRKGLTSVLLNKLAHVEDAVHPLPGAPAGVDIIYAGPAAPNPITLLSQPKVAELLESARAHYDIILLDCPPYNALADTAILAPLCDATLYLVRSGRIHKKFIAQVDKLAHEGKLPNLGYVVNAVDFKASSYSSYGYGYGYGYRYGYGHGYGYGNRAEDAKELAAAEQEHPQH